jgi:TolB-like protein
LKGARSDIREIGGKLNVTVLLEGSVRRVGDQLRVTAQLIRAADGQHLWSSTYDRQMGDVFAVQEEIAGSITSALRLKLGGRAAALYRQPGSL